MHPTRRNVRLSVQPLTFPVNPAGLVEALARQPGPAMLESTAADPLLGRYGIYTCRPCRTLAVRGDQLVDGAGQIVAPAGETGFDSDPLWQALRNEWSAVRAQPPAGAPPYGPGWIGYVGYEMGRRVCPLPGRAVRDLPLPDLHLAFYPAVLVWDRLAEGWWLSEIPPEDLPWRCDGGVGDLLADLARRSAGPVASCHAGRDVRPDTGNPSGGGEGGGASAIGDGGDEADASAAAAGPTGSARYDSNFAPNAYRRAVAAVVEHIAAGDIFQANLSQRLTIHPGPDPLAFYLALRRRNPAWYAAYLAPPPGQGDWVIASASPELFLRADERDVLTRPIKGTRPRTGQPDVDAAARQSLLASSKDGAELTMIIDLLRNDLGRVCRYGSIRVAQAKRLERHPTVFHLVGEVVGQLRPDVGPAELLRATFPGGSITGAPKIRAMEIIDELEGLARGPYTGCIGIVSVTGRTEWNIAIRTAVLSGGAAHVSVGGGIVADSDPAAEWQETLDKARALLESARIAGA